MKKLGENIRLKFLSVFIAILLWVFVINIQNPEVTKTVENIPVQVMNADMLSNYGLILGSHAEFTTTIKIKGKNEIVNKLSKDDIKATVDLEDCSKAGKTLFPITFNFDNLQNIQVQGEPDKVELNIERYKQVQKTVEVVLEGSNSKDAVYETKSIKPNIVTIAGPESLINGINSVKVLVDVESQKKDINVVEKYKVYNKKGKDITNSANLVKNNQNIQVEIDYFKAKEVPIVPTLIGHLENGYYLADMKVSPEKILIYGESQLVDKIEGISTKNITLPNKEGSIVGTTKVVIPSTIKTNYADDIKLNLEIKKEIRKTFNIDSSAINLINTSEKYNYSVSASSIDINIVGNENILNSLEIADLSPTINVEGLMPGDYRMKVRIADNQNLRLDGDNPIVKVSVTEK